MSSELAKVWNQSVVVENRTGASGNIGTDYVAKAPADGYTLLFAADAPMAISPALFPGKLAYDPVKDFAPIINVAQGGFVLMAHPSVPASNLKELIALVQSQPKKWSYASSGRWRLAALAFEMIRSMAGRMEMEHIPTRASARRWWMCSPARCDAVWRCHRLDSSGSKRQTQRHRDHQQDRARMLPMFAPAADTLPGFQVLGWYAVFAPAATPRDIVRQGSRGRAGYHQTPRFSGAHPEGQSRSGRRHARGSGRPLKTDIEMWTRLVKAASVKAEQ